ncbi:MAG TPA: MFS transporter [Chloroflexota bacterium]|nr:MFS transporter [Chloroflexota bacterium]
MPRFRRNLWLLLAQNLAVFLGIAVQGLVLNLYLVALGYREDFIGLVTFVQTAAIGVGAFPASAISPRAGPRRTLAAATLALGLSFGAMAILGAEPPLLVASALSGLAMAHVFVPSAPFLMDNTEPEQRRAGFAANFAALSVASVIGNAIGGVLPGLVGGADPGVGGYRAALLVGAALSLVGVAPLLAADDSRVPIVATPVAPTAGRAAPPSLRRDLVAMAAATSLLAGATGLVVAFFNVYLRDVVGASTATIGTVFAVASLSMAPASLGGPRAAKRCGPVLIIALTRLASVPLILALALVPPGIASSFLVYVGRAALVSVSQPLDNSFAMELVPPRLRARVAALRTVAWNGGWAVTTGLGGIAIVDVGYPAVFAAAAVLTLVSVGVHWTAFRGRSA